MWNEVFAEHKMKFPLCDGKLDWNLKSEKKWGLSCREQAICTKCTYKSKMYNMYDEIVTNKKGRKAATINQGLQVALHHTPISTTGFRKVCLGSNIPAPSVSGMQHAANKVSEKIEQTNIKDMKQQRELIKEVKRLRGEDPKTINVQADGVYNNAIYSGIGKTPFQPATQCTYTVIENETYKHKIVDSNPKSKLCSKKKKIHTTSTEVGEHAGTCSANINMRDNIGNEQRWAYECFENLLEDGLEVEEITTDPDSSAYRAAESLYEAGLTTTIPKHYLDTRHVAANHRKYINNLSSVCDIMPARLKAQRTKLQSRFATDLAARCQAEYTQAHMKFKDLQEMKSKLSFVTDAVISCYCGDHSDCMKYSFVCSKSKRRKSWVENSPYLESNFEIDYDEESEMVLRQCVNYRLAPHILEKTAKNTNTQKVEAVNRAIRATIPHNVTYTHNYKGRVHTAQHNVNHGPGNSIVIMCEAVGSPVEPGTSVARGLQQMEVHNEQMREYQQSDKHKIERCQQKHELFQIHTEQQEEKEASYEKNKLLPIKENSSVYPKDHPYGKIRKTRNTSYLPRVKANNEGNAL